MNGVDQLTPQVTPAGADTSLNIYNPEPSSSGYGAVNDFVSTITSAAGELGGVPLSATGSFAALLQAQIQAQMEMQTTSMISNLERSKHESKMSAIRNMRMS